MRAGTRREHWSNEPLFDLPACSSLRPWRARFLAPALLAAVLIAGSSPAAQPPRSPTTLHISAWVEGADSQTLDGLRADDFQVNVDGKPAAVRTVQAPGDDMVILLVLDLTEDLSLAGLAKESLVAETEALPANILLAVLHAQNGMQVLLDPTADRQQFRQAVEELPVSGNAGFLDTVGTASQLADALVRKSGVRTAVFYVTDSDVRNYREDYTNPVINTSDDRDISRRFPEGLVKEKIAKLQTQLQPYHAPLFLVHLEYSRDRLNEAYQAGLLQLAQESGGSGAFCRSRAEIAQAIQQTLRRMASLYLLSVPVAKPASRTVQLTVESSGHLLHYRSRFFLGAK
jgi:hypothetical protein